MRVMILALLLVVPLSAHSGKKERQQVLDQIRADVETHLASATVCCEGADDYGAAIDIAGKTEFALTYDRPLKQFEEGRSHFLLLRVPEAASPFAMTIFEASTWVENGGFVWPIVLLLDESFALVNKAVTDRKDGSWLGAMPAPSQRVDIDPKRHEYVVIYTDPALFGHETQVHWDVGVATKTITAPYVPTGMLRVAFHKKGFKCSMFYDSDSCLIKAGAK